MAKCAPLANISFSKIFSHKEKEVINNVWQFNTEVVKEGVCTSLEEWAFLILKPNIAKREVPDNKSEMHWKRMLEGQSQFIISNIDFTKDGGHVADKSQAASLSTNPTQFNNIPKH
jgi:hypothetical protein